MTNQEIIMRRELLQRLGDVRGKFGWYIYRNMKILNDACAEAIRIRDEAIMKYGEKNADGTFSLGTDSENWSDYAAEVEPVMQIDQKVKLVRMSRDEFDKLAEDAGLSAMELAILDETIVEDAT